MFVQQRAIFVLKRKTSKPPPPPPWTLDQRRATHEQRTKELLKLTTDPADIAYCPIGKNPRRGGGKGV